MKKYVSVILVISIILSIWLPVGAEYSAEPYAIEALGSVGDIIEFEIGGNDAIEKSANAQKPTESMDDNSYAIYEFESDWGAATYGIYVSVASLPEWNPALSVEFDDVKLADKMSFDAKDWGTFKEIYVGSIKCTGESHKLKVTAVKGMRLQKLRLKVVSEDVEESFLADMDNASNHVQVKEVIDKYDGKLIINYNDYFDKLIYRQHLDEALLDGEYTSLVETDKWIMTLLKSEVENPLVTITQGGVKVTELANGEFTINIEGKFEESLIAIAGLYSDDYMTLKSYGKAEIVPYEPAVISGLIATDDAKKLKIFFIENTTTLRPVDYPDILQSKIVVSPDGDDNATGLPSAPVATIQGAVDRAKELKTLWDRDITILLSEGEHILDGTVVLDESYSSHDTYGLHFRSLNSERPAVISGGYDVKEWNDADGDGIYTAQLPESITDVRQLYINEYPAQRARSNYYFFGDGRWDNENNNIDATGAETGYTEDGFYISNSNFPKLNKARDAEIAYLNKWSVQRLPVEDIEYTSGEKALVKMQQPYYSTALSMNVEGAVQPFMGHKFCVENDLSLLDEKGEFYFDKDTKVIYYKPFENEKLNTAKTTIAKTENLFEVKGSTSESKVKNVTFDNIKFRYGGYYTEVNEQGVVVMQAENMVNPSKGMGQAPNSSGVGRTLNAQITIENAEGIEFNNCDISCMGSTAVRLGAGVTDSKVEGCIMRDIGGSSVSIGSWDSNKTLAENITVKNNVISRVGIDFMSSPGISIYYAKNVDVVHNTLSHTPYSGISVNWGWNSAASKELGCGGHNISFNRIYDTSNVVEDGGQIYNLGHMTNVTEEGNYLSDSPDFGGIYLDNGSSGITLTNNVMTNCSVDAIFAGTASNNVNNKAYNNWSDHEQRQTTGEWIGEGSSFEKPVVISDGNWPAEARAVMNSAGVEEAYKVNLAKIEKPEWRTVGDVPYPLSEASEENTVYMTSTEYTKYYDYIIEGMVAKKKPNTFNYSKIPSVGGFEMGDWVEYEIEVPKSGYYTFTADYNILSGSQPVYVFITDTALSGTYDNFVNWTNSVKSKANFANYKLEALSYLPWYATDCFAPHTFKDSTGADKQIELSKGKYYVRFVSMGTGFSFSRLRLKLVSQD